MADFPGAGEHPLLNPQILSQLFKFSRDFQTLTQCRLVCSEWYKSTFSHWRSSVGAIRLGERADPNILTPTGWNVHEFLQNCIHGTTLDNIPANSHQYFTHWKEDPPKGYILSKINLKSDCNPVFRVYDPEIDPVPPNTINFWQSVGFQITYIHFDHCVFQGDFQFLFEKMVVEMMPNLQSLKVTDSQLVPKITNDRFSRVQTYVHEPDSFKKNVKRNPNLKRIQISGPCPMCFYQLLIVSPKVEEVALSTNMDWRLNDYWAKYLALTLGGIRYFLDGVPYPLKKLDLLNVVLDAVTGKDWRTRNVVMSFPFLEELSMNVYIDGYQIDKDLDVKNGDDLKMAFSPEGLLSAWTTPTLKILKVFRPPIFPTPGFPLFHEGSAKGLLEFYLWGNFVKSFNFLWNMPQLKVLYMDFRCHDHLDKIEKLFYSEDQNNGWSVEKNRNWFRQVYKPEQNFTWEICRNETGKLLRMERLERLHLDVPFQAECLNMMVKWMPHLTILEVVLDQKGFQAVCGWLTGLVELKLLYGSLIDDHTLTGLPEEKGMPVMRARSLTALKKLKRFEMKEIICNVEQGRLGDKSVYEGFLKMEGLKSVSICVSEQISTEAENALRKHLDKVEVIGKHQSNENKICCQLKTFYCDV